MLTPSLPSRVKPLLAHENGFSLVEIAVVLVIITLLLTMVAVPIATQVEQRRVVDTQKLLENAKDALYGYAAANGRLPCPATAGSAGQESPIGGGVCTTLVGFLPAVTLGITPVDIAGFANDAWEDGTASRRIGYAVSNANSSALTTTDGIKTATMASVSASPSHLYVCGTGLAAAPPTTNCGVSVTTLADKAPVVLFSYGKNNTANSFDETNNQNGDKVFSSGTPNATFDDMVTWMSLNTLFDRMLKANKLP